MRRAFAAEELELCFEPQYHLASGRLIGAEARIRWDRLGRGILSATDLIPLVEDRELLRALGTWVVREAAFAALKLRAVDPLFRIWFHLSAAELRDAGVLHALDEARSVSCALVIAVREHAVVENEPGAWCAFRMLKDAGFAVAIDNLGGSSSLPRLATLPVDVVKLDRSLTAELPHSAEDRRIVEAIVELGRRFRFETAVGAVENDAQAAWLRNAGCTFAQGRGFGCALRRDELNALLVTAAMVTRSRTLRPLSASLSSSSPPPASASSP